MTRLPHRGRPGVGLLATRFFALIAAIVLMTSATGAAAAASPTGGDAPPETPPARSSTPLSDGVLRAAVDQSASSKPLPSELKVKDGRVLVEVIYTGAKDAAERTIVKLGGEVNGYAGTSLLQALVPIENLVRLEKSTNVTQVRAPITANAPLSGAAAPAPQAAAVTAAITGQEVSKTNAASWQAAGFTGTGIKVGIIDYFNQVKWNSALGAGEVAAPAGTFCRDDGGACNIFGNTEFHGVAVAETVHEMAPGAALYLATVSTSSDLQAAVDYFGNQGVKIITRSLGSGFDGPGNGAGPIDQVVASAVSKGMTWFNSAGNSAGSNHNGGYWRGTWSDTNADGWLNWSGSGVQGLPVRCGFIHGFRWSDWGANRTDYDVYLYDTTAGGLKLKGEGDQGAGANPIELAGAGPTCSGDNDIDYLFVKLFAPGSGTAGDVLEFMTGEDLPQYGLASNPYSVASPAADSASTGEITVGAIDPWNGTQIASYSSQGPTNDTRVKPDFATASCFDSLSYAPNCFNGTSAATPAAAGAAALVLQAGLASTPAQLKTYLVNQAAAHDRGTAGNDYVYGAGELILPAPPSSSKPTAPGNVTATPLSSTSIRLNWTDSSGETSYNFFRWSGTAWVVFATGAANQVTVTDTGRTPSTTYYYYVCAVNAAGQTCPATYVSATTLAAGKPTAPGSVTATPLTQSSIRLNWTDSSGETSYTFYRWSGSAWAGIGTGAANQVAFTDSTIVTPGLYYYLVCANNAAGQTCAPYVSANNSVT
jgi:subtilisin family serine protease